MFNVLYGMMASIPEAVTLAVIAGFIRSIFGWYENSNKDNKITEFEYKQLFGTIAKYFAYMMLLIAGIPSAAELMGMTVELESAAGLAVSLTFILDIIKTTFKTNK